jgi:hypothetical protein
MASGEDIEILEAVAPKMALPLMRLFCAALSADDQIRETSPSLFFSLYLSTFFFHALNTLTRNYRHDESTLCLIMMLLLSSLPLTPALCSSHLFFGWQSLK